MSRQREGIKGILLTAFAFMQRAFTSRAVTLMRDHAMWLVVFVTTSSLEEAERIAQKLLEERLAACVNIIPRVHSRFWWKGKIEHSDEALLIVKSTSEVFDELAESVKAVHSYEVPEILAVPIQSGLTEYFSWMDEVIKDSRSGLHDIGAFMDSEQYHNS